MAVKTRRLAVFLVALLLMMQGFYFSSRDGLGITNYAISSPKIKQPIRIVQLTDLHNSEFGQDNARLIEMTRKQAPDIIVLTGDMLNGDERETQIPERLIEQLVKIAPVYASRGNHEKANSRVFGTNVMRLYEQAGATVLDSSFEDIEVNGQRLRLGGILGYCLAEPYLRTGEAKPEEIAYLRRFEDTELMTVLLCHYPLCWIVNDNLEQWDIDVVFSGHDHGGQIRLPWLGGIYAPDQGYFPGHECGLYYSADRQRVMVLSRGLGSRGNVPRMNNVPEIVVVDILPRTGT
ncbi:MAG: metallophosphoesterase [Clostridia bacterium]|nr:metallophosphoesterase [Clostridia bacterium]